MTDKAAADLNKAAGCYDGFVMDVGNQNLAILLLFLNVVFPGLGTVISACIGPKCNCMAFICAILQMVTCWICIGWCWSIAHGVAIYKKTAKV